MGEGIVTKRLNGLDCIYQFPNGEIVFSFSKLKEKRDAVKGRLSVVVRFPELSTEVFCADVNLASARTQKETARIIEERVGNRDEINFDRITKEAFTEALKHHETPVAAQKLEKENATTDIDYILYPTIPDRVTSLWYAPGASGKTLTAMYAALCVQNGVDMSGYEIPRRNVLYLDYETDQKTATARFSMLANKKGYFYDLPFYRRCYQRLLDDADNIAEDIERIDPGLLIIDSAGLAVGGDIASAETVIQLFNVLRRMQEINNCAILILTHITKAERRKDEKKRLPLGSVYFENLPRITYEIIQNESEHNRMSVSIIPRKVNFKRPESVGLRYEFEEDGISVFTTGAEDIATEDRVISNIILEELASGEKTAKELADSTGTSIQTVWVLLSKLKKKGKVYNPRRGVWALSFTELSGDPEEDDIDNFVFD